MNPALLLLPDFLLILLGFLLVRYSPLDKSVWEGAEKLVYYLLFPALLINAVNQTRFDWNGTSHMLIVAGLAFGSAIFLGYLSKYLAHHNQKLWVSGFQTAFRFNSYIAFAVAGRLFGEEGVALMALTVGCFVPIANAVAVWALAKHSDSHLLKELAKNPLLVATIFGLGTNLLDWRLPEPVSLSLGRLGSASIAMGLLAVGAGLVWIKSKRDGLLIAYWTTVKLLAMPTIAFLAGRYANLPAPQLNNVVLFAAMPTATSAYVLANRMRGDGAIVAISISIMTIAAAITLPIWVLMLGI